MYRSLENSCILLLELTGSIPIIMYVITLYATHNYSINANKVYYIRWFGSFFDLINASVMTQLWLTQHKSKERLISDNHYTRPPVCQPFGPKKMEI